jgi:Protein of unknown function (DUF2948)
MSDLKLIALDTEDLSVISAHLQDAVVRVADMTYLPNDKRFAVVANRFNWAKALDQSAGQKSAVEKERRRTGLRFERVLAAKVHGLDLKDKKSTLALLAITFEAATDADAADGPDGHVTLTFSGGAAIRLKVECVEAELKDLGAAWSAASSPAHPDDKKL